jgi:hypothetical protein
VLVDFCELAISYLFTALTMHTFRVLNGSSKFQNACKVNYFSDEGVGVLEIVDVVVLEVEKVGRLALLFDYDRQNMCRAKLSASVKVNLAKQTTE